MPFKHFYTPNWRKSEYKSDPKYKILKIKFMFNAPNLIVWKKNEHVTFKTIHAMLCNTKCQPYMYKNIGQCNKKHVTFKNAFNLSL